MYTAFSDRIQSHVYDVWCIVHGALDGVEHKQFQLGACARVRNWNART